ncbi:DUF2970 domain-containing protein [Methylococcus sp. EFPC2]|uniref:DUF2970 domain-containing protein n=1 Tax=Methylococcus sp. EFPC2 TaxID=2812648 RepID=UPI0019672036|nr:DUF2970 domain-containing protein [Methylococcus sp. EFPC2]QSA97950.1 DUF2970 domain-containing protein [Methylococcus sp. EFPC2]
MSENSPSKPNLFQVVASVLAAGFGVQSQKNRERDFVAGSAKSYVIVGVIATVLFVLTLYGIVKLILGLAGA